jgi:TetR/AcrR family transcriptional regulator, transcriptional repressor of bet genes
MPRQVDHQLRRREIVYAVWAVIAEDGLDAVSLRRVAAEAGISLGRVQHYFGSKEELLQHSCRTVIDIAATSFAERTAAFDALDTVRALVGQPVPRDEPTRIGTAVWQAFLTRAASDPGLRAIIGEATVGAQRELGRLLALAQAGGEVPRSLDPQRLGQALFALGHGLAQQVLIAGLTAEEALAAIDVTLAGLTDRGAAPAG